MSPLEKIIREMITHQGPISLAVYMELALQHPEYGYYRVQEPIGRTGDFITAPEVSQMFGEMVGVWFAETWRSLEKPDPFALVELGPGKGTMMRDVLRATGHVGGFHEAKQLCLLDSDKALRPTQYEKLGQNAPRYFDDLSQLPPMPSLIVANEFFDAMPIRQFERGFAGWTERMVGLEKDELVLLQRPLEPAEEKLIPPNRFASLPGTIYEFSPKSQNMMRDLARRIATHKGALLVIDYGYVAPSGSATVQAVSRHAYTDIFERPGEVDLTGHIDFEALAEAAKEAGVAVSPVIGQGEFLKNLGIEIRADALKSHATLPQRAAIDAELHRLIDEDQMGTHFKVMEVRG